MEPDRPVERPTGGGDAKPAAPSPPGHATAATSVAPPTPARSDGGSRGAFITAGIGLAGVAVGAAASAVIAFAGFHHDDAKQSRDLRREVYVNYATTADKERNVLEGLALQTADLRQAKQPYAVRIQGDLRELLKQVQEQRTQLALLRIYSDGPVYLAALDVQKWLQEAVIVATRELVSDPSFKGTQARLQRVNDALAVYLTDVRVDLGLKPY